jgi:Ni/Co efflux regulator RcnB
MNRIFSRIGTAVVAVVITASSFGMASAAAMSAQHPQISSNVELAQYREERHQDYRRDRDHRDRYEQRRDRRGYWNGRRGYRDYRKGYRRHSDGYYYPRSMFQLYIR